MANENSFIDNFLQDPAVKQLEEKYKSINVSRIENKPVSIEEFIFSKDYVGIDRVSPKQAKLLLALDNMEPTPKYDIELADGRFLTLGEDTDVMCNGIYVKIQNVKEGDEVDI